MGFDMSASQQPEPERFSQPMVRAPVSTEARVVNQQTVPEAVAFLEKHRFSLSELAALRGVLSMKQPVTPPRESVGGFERALYTIFTKPLSTAEVNQIHAIIQRNEPPPLIMPSADVQRENLTKDPSLRPQEVKLVRPPPPKTGKALAEELVSSLRLDMRTSFWGAYIHEAKITLPPFVSERSACEALNALFKHNNPAAKRDAINLSSFEALFAAAGRVPLRDISKPREIRIKPARSGFRLKPRDQQELILRNERSTLVHPLEQALIAGVVACTASGSDVFRGLTVRGSEPGLAVRLKRREGITLHQVADSHSGFRTTVSSKPAIGFPDILDIIERKDSLNNPSLVREAYLELADTILRSCVIGEEVLVPSFFARSTPYVSLTIPAGVQELDAVEALEINFKTYCRGVATSPFLATALELAASCKQPVQRDDLSRPRTIRIYPVVRGTLDQTQQDQELLLVQKDCVLPEQIEQLIAAAAYTCKTRGKNMFAGLAVRGKYAGIALHARELAETEFISGYESTRYYDHERSDKLAASGKRPF
jgi:hypothetical protein